MTKHNKLRQIEITEAIEAAEHHKQIRAYQCHYCAHCDEYNGVQTPCELGINPDAHNQAAKCRKEFVQYEYYDRQAQVTRAIEIPAECYDRRYKDAQEDAE